MGRAFAASRVSRAEALSSLQALRGAAMPGTPHPRAVPGARWPRELQGAALLLGLGAGLYWVSFGLGPTVRHVPGVGRIHVDLLLAWGAVLLQVAAWPRLWAGLRDLRARRPKESSPVLAYRAFWTTLGLVLGAVVLLPLQYHAYASADVWLLVLYVSMFPYLPWTFVPILALHGILFARVANYQDGLSRYLAEAGAVLLFGVASATTGVVLEHPGTTAFFESWSVGRGILPAAGFAGYALIAMGLTLHAMPSAAKPHEEWLPH